MNALRLTGAVLALALVVAVAGLLGGGSSGCAVNCSEGIDIWDCAAPDGGLLGSAAACSPSERPANCPCAVGVPIGHNDPATGMPYVAPQGDCAWLDGGPIGCNGQCVAGAPAGWSDPGLVWIGADVNEALAACPPAAPLVNYEGWAGLTNPTCPTCNCVLVAGSCTPPATIAASASPCGAADAGAPVPLGPMGWDGGCASYAAMGSAVGSVTAPPLGVVGESCSKKMQPGPPIAGDPPGIWSTFALGCGTNATSPSVGGVCADPNKICVPAVPATPAGFRMCIFNYDGAQQCPDVGPYSEPLVFVSQATGSSSCSECMCALQSGSCSQVLSLYTSSACEKDALLASETLSSAGPLCYGVADAGVGSEALAPATYSPGTCTPSSIEPTQSSTYCCVPD